MKILLKHEGKRKALMDGYVPKMIDERRFGLNKHVNITSVIDVNLFLRNKCKISGSEQHPPMKYSVENEVGSFDSTAFFFQTISNRNYCMRNLCVDNDGAIYTIYRKNNDAKRNVVFLPRLGLNDLSKNEFIVDACHLDLICPKTHRSLLRPSFLLDRVKTTTNSIFIKGYLETNRRKKNFLVKSVQRCNHNLLCFSYSGSKLNPQILIELSKCKNLRGITLSEVEWDEEKASLCANGLKNIIDNCSNLRWLMIQSTKNLFDNKCWVSLSSVVNCPDLEVLWVESDNCCWMDKNNILLKELHRMIVKLVQKRQSKLKIAMIYPDWKYRSCHEKRSATIL